MDRSPCLELYPDEHEIQSDSWHAPAYFGYGVNNSMSMPMALALVTWLMRVVGLRPQLRLVLEQLANYTQY
jgi:hypothetical protein